MTPSKSPGNALEADDGQQGSLMPARIFVAAVFSLLALSFLTSTYLLMREFPESWRTLAIAHSHLFIFFPLFGVLALAAFYLPSVVFTDLYWRHIRFGAYRYLFGLAVALVGAWYVSTFLLGPFAMPRALWEVSQTALAADRGEPADCGTGRACTRLALAPAMQSLREKAGGPSSLSKFARACKPDPLVETPEENGKLRWCFASGRMTNAADCCTAQSAFATAVNSRAAAAATRSKLADYDEILQPVKIFFILVVLVIGGMLVFWRDRVGVHYPDHGGTIDRHVMIGGIAMLLWPVMDYAYLDVTNVLFGRPTDDVQIRLSLVAAPWAMLLLFHYLRRFARKVEVIGQIVGVAGGVGALLARDELKDWAVKLVGIGMPWWMPWSMIAICVAGFVLLFVPRIELVERKD